MYQSGKRRSSAEETPICSRCQLKGKCTTEPIHEWKFVLDFCQDFKELDTITSPNI